MNSEVEERVRRRQTAMVHTMFIHTADDNYIGARAAFFERRDYDFWWLTLHAVEKYFKATLLLNGVSANQPNHNLKTLLRRLKGLDARLTPPEFIRPKLAGAASPFEETRPFLERLNAYGNPANRYASYSYVVSGTDIFRADHLVYWARRNARVFQHTYRDGVTIDFVDALSKDSRVWRLHDGSPLEKLADAPNSPAAKHFVRANVAFFPDRRHQPLRNRGTYVRNGPFFNLLNSLKNSEPDSDQRAEMRAMLTWAIKNIYLPKDEMEHLKRVLAAHP